MLWLKPPLPEGLLPGKTEQISADHLRFDMRDPELQCKHVLYLCFFVTNADRDAAEGVIHWQAKGILREEFPFSLFSQVGKRT